MKKLFLLGAAIALFAMAGCSRIDTGSVGIERGFTGNISDRAVGQGLHLSILSSYIPVDTTQTRVIVGGLHPKDANGVFMQDVQVVVTYSLDPSRVAAFYRKTKELDAEPGGEYYTLGLDILRGSVVPQAVQYATEESNLIDIAANQVKYAKIIQRNIVSMLNTLYPGINPFVIQSVTVPKFQLPDSIQKQMNAQAGYRAEMDTMAVKMQVIEKRQAVVSAQETVDANALAASAKASGLTVDQVIAWKRAQALEKMAGDKPNIIVKAN